MLTISSVLHRARVLFPDRVAVRTAGMELTYSKLAERVNKFAAAFTALGIRQGDRVAILDVNSSQYLEAYYATTQIGVILIPLNSRLAAEEVAYVLKDSGASVLLYGARFESIVKEIQSRSGVKTYIAFEPPTDGSLGSIAYEDLLGMHAATKEIAAVSLEDTCCIYYTSGTTGTPKGVCLTFANMTSSMYDSAISLPLGADEVWMHAAPLFHLVDAWAVWAIPLLGGTQVPLHFEPATFARLVQSTQTTSVALPPTMIGMLLGSQEDMAEKLKTLRMIMFGGSPASPEVLDKAIKSLPAKLIHAYGTTETSGIITLNTLASTAQEMKAAGFPIPQIEMEIVDDDGRTLPAGEVGEVVIRGDRVMSGYWQKPEATKEALRSGWYHTGDLGVFDSRTGITILDRKKDMIISGGENVYSAEVEAALALHPSVQEVAVIGVPHEKWGEAVTAIVVTRSPTSSEELIEHCKQRIAGYKAPKVINFVQALPKNATGKVVKRTLREQYSAQKND